MKPKLSFIINEVSVGSALTSLLVSLSPFHPEVVRNLEMIL